MLWVLKAQSSSNVRTLRAFFQRTFKSPCGRPLSILTPPYALKTGTGRVRGRGECLTRVLKALSIQPSLEGPASQGSNVTSVRTNSNQINQGPLDTFTFKYCPFHPQLIFALNLSSSYCLTDTLTLNHCHVLSNPQRATSKYIDTQSLSWSLGAISILSKTKW